MASSRQLAVADEGLGGELRYRLLETLRAYALDRVDAAGELDTVRNAHTAWWADWLEPRGDMPTDDILEDFRECHATLKAALDGSVCRGGDGAGARGSRRASGSGVVCGRFLRQYLCRAGGATG